MKHELLRGRKSMQQSNYEIYGQADFNQPSYYPLNQSVDGKQYLIWSTVRRRMGDEPGAKEDSLKANTLRTAQMFDRCLEHAESFRTRACGRRRRANEALQQNPAGCQCLPHTCSRKYYFTGLRRGDRRYQSSHPQTKLSRSHTQNSRMFIPWDKNC
ncbi:MAG: hypothetical protein GDA48_15410 [Hormoscilla sp. GM102CHS1]|nr:hypothetical protein [Hormoscilla sp. GM102CHS1]